MCTLALLRRPAHAWPLLLAANRDELRTRPARPPGRHWPDRAHVRGGLDLEAGGTWLGVNDDGVVAAVQELTGGFGADVVIDAVGRPETWRQAFYARDLAGRMVMVGVPNRTDRIDVPAIDMYARGGSIKPAWYGDCLPERDFPAYVELAKQGRFPLGEFVSERIGVGDIETAFDKMKRGDVLRSVVEF